ncbi:MAG: M14 family zinc carboxypeptidase [Terracidiphilus sp.]|jgi:hypothetical protein
MKRLIHAIVLAMLLGGVCAAQTANDEEYTKEIRENTTEPFLTTPLVDHLPASSTVPTPRQFLGYIAGAPGHLTYSEKINAYYRALAAATPRVKVFSAGQSEEGREFLIVAVSDESNIAQIDHYREISSKLADPRQLSEEQAQALEREGVPFYWASASIHSPETGSPEMLMELAYRLAVEDTQFIRNIRKNAIFLITPVVEVDGHDRMVDLFHYHAAFPDKPTPGLVYWGHYVAHDNNRDAIGMGLALTQMMMKEFLAFHPQVLHDLHESVPYLYISTGTGPYNAWLDPMVIDEWEQMATNELEKFSEDGVLGVWDHGYYDGWAPNYMFFIANNHNSMGRFYETFGNMFPDTRVRTASGDRPFRTWFRNNPPLRQVLWSFRDNVNMQQSGLLFALDYTANHRQKMLTDFYLKSKRAIEKATTEGPAAWAIDNDGLRPGLDAALVQLLQKQGVEVERLNSAFHIDAGAPAKSQAGAHFDSSASGHVGDLAPGTYIIRMDQPYCRVADMLLDTQYYSVHDPAPYDDTGWSLGPLFDVRTTRITDPAILRAPMTPVVGPARLENAGVTAAGSSAEGASLFVIEANAEPALASLRFRLPGIEFFAANGDFTLDDRQFHAGSFLIPAKGNPLDLRDQLQQAARELNLSVYASSRDPAIARHALALPRVALLHTWTDTQNEGWFRLALDHAKVPYNYLSTTLAAATPNLRDKFDVILLPPVRGGAEAILNGIPKRSLADGADATGPIPWEHSELTPNFGVLDHAADIRGGLGFSGLANLKQFVNDGGLLIVVGSSSKLATELGFADGVRILQPSELKAQGSILRAEIEHPLNPVTYGYSAEVPVYFGQAPVFEVSVPRMSLSDGYFSPSPQPERTSGRGSLTDPDIPQGRPWAPAPSEPALSRRQKETFVDPEDLLDSGDVSVPKALWPRVLLRFADKDLLVSGLLSGAESLQSAPAIVEVPMGRGHVLLFAINPMWREETAGSFMLVGNAILNFDSLDLGNDAASAASVPKSSGH